MPTNSYFNKFNNVAEQDLVQDLVDEAIQIHGVNMTYIPRKIVTQDKIFGEDRTPKFEDGREIEMYVDTYDGFEGEGEVMSQFGLEIRDEMTVTVSRRRFQKEFADLKYEYPNEGDIIFFPINNALFEINFVEREYNFFNFGKSLAYQMKCSLFKYSGDDFDSGNSIIDGVTSSAMTELVKVTTAGLVDVELNSNGRPIINRLIESDEVNVIQGDTTSEAIVIGTDYSGMDSNGANALLYLAITNFKPLEVIERAAVESTSIVTPDGEKGFIALSAERSGEFFVAPDLEDNTEFEAEASEFIDFTDIDPFSEGDL